MFSPEALGHGDARDRLPARALRRRAQALLRLGRARRARASWPTAELADVRVFGAPRALGVALRVAGLPQRRRARARAARRIGGRRCDGSPALLERAHSLAELGAALRRAGRRAAAREPLAEALDLAARCGARPLAAARARGAQGDRRPPATRVAHRRGSADPQRAARRAAGRRGPLQPRDRARALRDAQDRRGPPRARLRQARDRGPRPAAARPSMEKRPGCRPSSERARRLRDPAVCITRRPKEASMTMTAREAFERGTDTFNAHDLDGFAEVLADDVVFDAPGGMRGEGKAACARVLRRLVRGLPRRARRGHRLHIIDDVAVEEGTFTGTHDGDPPRPGRRHPADRPRRQRWTTSRCSASATASTCLLQPDVRPALDARAARARPRDGARGLRVRSSSRRQREP